MIFAADERARAAIRSLTEEAGCLYDLLSAAADAGHRVDAYAWVATGEALELLGRAGDGSRLLLRFPGGFDERMARKVEQPPEGLELRIYDAPDSARAHAKIYVIHLDGRRLVVAGSSNATSAGMRTNLEANVALCVEHGDDATADPSSVFEELWARSRAYDPLVHRPAPLVSPEAPMLFDYQRNAVDALRESLMPAVKAGRFRKGSEVPGGMVSLPTAAGKTTVAIRFLLEHALPTHVGPPRRALWIADTDEQVKQAHAAFSAQARPLESLHIRRLTSEWSGPVGPALDLATVSFATRKLLASRLDKNGDDTCGPFSVIVIDEAHHVHRQNTEYPLILHRLPHAARVGLSATPHRHPRDQDDGLYCYFNPEPGRKPRLEPLFERKMEELADRTHRGVPIFAKPKPDSIETNWVLDLADVGHRESNLKGKRFDDARRVDAIVDGYQRARHAPAMFFAVDIADANALTRALLARGVRAQVVHSGTPVVGCLFDQEASLTDTQRATIVSEIASEDGALEVVVNVEVFIEGVDIPRLKSVFIARPTFSPRVQLQMQGRALRGPAMGGTEICYLVQCTDRVINEDPRHPLQNPGLAAEVESAGEAPDEPTEWPELPDWASGEAFLAAGFRERARIAAECIRGQGELSGPRLAEIVVERLLRPGVSPTELRDAAERFSRRAGHGELPHITRSSLRSGIGFETR